LIRLDRSDWTYWLSYLLIEIIRYINLILINIISNLDHCLLIESQLLIYPIHLLLSTPIHCLLLLQLIDDFNDFECDFTIYLILQYDMIIKWFHNDFDIELELVSLMEPIDQSIIEDIGDTLLLVLEYSGSSLIFGQIVVCVHLVNMV